jgi:undecaprenyl-diphosphatase
VAFLVLAVVFITLTVAVWSHPAPFGVDIAARRALNGWHRPAMTVVTHLGSISMLLPVVVVVGLVSLVLHRDLRAALFLVATLAGAVLLYDIVKPLLARPRPPGGAGLAGYSFPSGHTVAATATWGALAFLLGRGAPPWVRRTLVAIGLLVAVAVGLSRVALDAHWATDVAGGFALGGAWLTLVTFAMWRRAVPPDPSDAAEREGQPDAVSPAPLEPEGTRVGSRRR